MAKMIDITEKLTFDGNPSLIIKGKKLEVNADAPTMLRIMALMSVNDIGPKEVVEIYDMIFPDKSKKEVEKLGLNFNDLIIVVQEAVELITRDVNNQGE
ncbi:MAG: hypothetical protein QM657_18475 [Lacrimispora sp.]|uniref:hypothetical protein n=1 Tax=Lacrimispora sp. TaxID=2719234 RepID=UPI0039E62F37